MGVDLSRLPENVRRKIVPNGHDGCWEWVGSRTRGYGSVCVNGRTRRAHRAVYEAFFGPIPPKLVLDHLCRHTECVNPAHLEPVSGEENTRRGMSYSAVNARKTHCPKGHPYDEENTLHKKPGYRRCKRCHKASDQKMRAKRMGERNQNILDGNWIERCLMAETRAIELQEMLIVANERAVIATTQLHTLSEAAAGALAALGQIDKAALNRKDGGWETYAEGYAAGLLECSKIARSAHQALSEALSAQSKEERTPQKIVHAEGCSIHDSEFGACSCGAEK